MHEHQVLIYACKYVRLSHQSKTIETSSEVHLPHVTCHVMLVSTVQESYDLPRDKRANRGGEGALPPPAALGSTPPRASFSLGRRWGRKHGCMEHILYTHIYVCTHRPYPVYPGNIIPCTEYHTGTIRPSTRGRGHTTAVVKYMLRMYYDIDRCVFLFFVRFLRFSLFARRRHRQQAGALSHSLPQERGPFLFSSALILLSFFFLFSSKAHVPTSKACPHLFWTLPTSQLVYANSFFFVRIVHYSTVVQ